MNAVLFSLICISLYLFAGFFFHTRYGHIEKDAADEVLWRWAHDPTYLSLILFFLSSLIPLVNLLVGIYCLCYFIASSLTLPFMFDARLTGVKGFLTRKLRDDLPKKF